MSIATKHPQEFDHALDILAAAFQERFVKETKLTRAEGAACWMAALVTESIMLAKAAQISHGSHKRFCTEAWQNVDAAVAHAMRGDGSRQ